MKIPANVYFLQVIDLLRPRVPDDDQSVLAEVNLLANLCVLMQRRGMPDLFDPPSDLSELPRAFDAAWRQATTCYQLAEGFPDTQRLMKLTHGTIKRARSALMARGLCTPCPAPAPRVAVGV